MKSLPGLVLVLVLVPGMAVPNMLTGQQAESADAGQQAARQLLEQYWNRDLKTRRAAESFHSDYLKTHPTSGVEQFAWTLNRIQFAQYRQASAAADTLTEHFPDDWDAWHARIWLQMAVGNVNESLVSMQELAKAVRTAGPLDEATRLTVFTRLGRLYAFAEGPASGKARDTTLAETLTAITRGLDDTDLGSFEDQRAQLAGQYTGMIEEMNENVAEQKQAAAREQAEQIEQINRESRSISERQSQIESEARVVRERAESEFAQLQGQAAPFQSSLAAVETRIVVSRDEAARTVAAIARLEQLAASEPDSFLRDNYLRQAGAARLTLANVNAILIDLRGQYDGIVGQLAAIENQMAAVQNESRSRLSGLDRESSQLSKRATKNQRALSKMNQPEGDSGYLKNVNARLAHLPTFDPFPTEEMRQKLLSGF